MMSVALMGGTGTQIGKGKSIEGSAPTWGSARIGQCVIVMELLVKLDQLTRAKSNPLVVSNFFNWVLTLVESDTFFGRPPHLPTLLLYISSMTSKQSFPY
jgi:hypothetical protein